MDIKRQTKCTTSEKKVKQKSIKKIQAYKNEKKTKKQME